MHPGTPSSVPVPLLVYAVGCRVGEGYQPLPASRVALDRTVVESELAELDDQTAVIIEQRILPWAPASEVEHRSSPFEYTVGYSDGDHHTPLGQTFSTDRAAIEGELTEVIAAIAESNTEEPFDVLMLERAIYPWYLARPKAVKLLG